MQILEVIKEAGRVVILAAISYLLTGVVLNTLLMAIVGDKLSPEVIVLVVGFLTSILRGVEKELHDMDSRVQLPL